MKVLLVELLGLIYVANCAYAAPVLSNASLASKPKDAGQPPAAAAPSTIGGFPAQYFYHGDNPAKRAPIDQLIGKPAPAILVTPPHGKTAPVMKDKIVVLDLWTTWCPHCIEAIPENKKLISKYADKNVVFISVCTDQGQEKLPKIIKDNGIDYPVYKDFNNKMQKPWRTMFFPMIDIIDAKGIVRATGVGPQAMSYIIDALLKEPAGAPQ